MEASINKYLESRRPYLSSSPVFDNVCSVVKSKFAYTNRREPTGVQVYGGYMMMEPKTAGLSCLMERAHYYYRGARASTRTRSCNNKENPEAGRTSTTLADLIGLKLVERDRGSELAFVCAVVGVGLPRWAASQTSS